MAFVFEEESEIPIPDDKETFAQSMGRHVARSGARAIEALAGLPGDIRASALGLVGKGAQKLGASEEVISESEKATQFLPFLGRLPTSTEIREELTEPLTGEFLKPKGKVEEIADEIVGDAAALLVPIKGKVPRSTRFLKHLLRGFGTSAGANIASELTGALGAGEKAQTATKLGSMMLLGSLGRGKPKDYISKLYKEAEESIKGSPKVSAKTLNKELTSLKKNMKKGLGAPSEKAVVDKIEKLQGKIKEGKIGIDELWASKRSLNEEMSKALFETPNKAARQRARHLFKKMNRDMNKELAKYGEKNPKFGKSFKEAEEGYAALHQSQAIGNFIKRNAKYSPSSVLLYPLVHALGKPGIGGAAGGALAYKTGQLGYRLAKSSTLRRHYRQVLQQAAKQNAPAMNRALQKLDEELTKDKQKEPISEGRFILED